MMKDKSVNNDGELSLRSEPVNLSVKLNKSREARAHSTVKSFLAKRLVTSKLFGPNPVRSINGSGPAYYVPAYQRVTVKAFISKHTKSPLRTQAQSLSRHLRYLVRPDQQASEFYNQDTTIEIEDIKKMASQWESDRHHFRLIISPEHGDKITDFDAYIKAVMDDVALDLREPRLTWIGINHFDTDQPHAHVLIRGKRMNGKDLILPRSYISHGIRNRAQERAQESLGDQTRDEAEAGLWYRTTANYWTDIDAKLTTIAKANNGLIPAHHINRHDTFGAITRARLMHLNTLSLTKSQSLEGVILVSDAKERLRELQRNKDLIRSHWETYRQSGLSNASEAIMRAKTDAHHQSGQKSQRGAQNHPTSPDHDLGR